MPKDILQRLQDLKSDLPKAKSEMDNFKGQLQSTMENIEKISSAETLDEAVEVKEKMDDKIRKMDRELKDGVEDLEEKFQW